MVGNCKCNFTITNKHSFRILLLVDGRAEKCRQKSSARKKEEERNSSSAKMKGILSIAPNQSSMGRHLGGIKTTFQQLCHPQEGDQKMSSTQSNIYLLIKAKSFYQNFFSHIFLGTGWKRKMSHFQGYVTL